MLLNIMIIDRNIIENVGSIVIRILKIDNIKWIIERISRIVEIIFRVVFMVFLWNSKCKIID